MPGHFAVFLMNSAMTDTTNNTPPADVLRAAAALVSDFAGGDSTAYFSHFDPDSTFVFYTHPERLETRAAYEDRDGAFELVAKFQGALWTAQLDHSPLDVVGWHGNYAPYRYDLRRFNTIGTISYDHPDPSINTVLTSPTTAVPSKR